MESHFKTCPLNVAFLLLSSWSSSQNGESLNHPIETENFEFKKLHSEGVSLGEELVLPAR